MNAKRTAAILALAHVQDLQERFADPATTVFEMRAMMPRLAQAFVVAQGHVPALHDVTPELLGWWLSPSRRALAYLFGVTVVPVNTRV